MPVILPLTRKARYARRIAALHRELGIPPDYVQQHRIPLQLEARSLTDIGMDIYQRGQRLIPSAAVAWRAMQDSAAGDGVELQLVSAYRSVAYQESIIKRKLEQGACIDEILRVSAAPGYSEHHTGRALDLTTPGCAVLEEEFERTEAFAWLTESAAKYSFSLSYPHDNPFNVIYEPWHWAWTG